MPTKEEWVIFMWQWLIPSPHSPGPLYMVPAAAAAAAAKSCQSCPTLWDPRDGSPPGSAVSRILQARTLEWVTISFSNAWKWKVKMKSLSCVQLFATPWTAAYQAPPSMGFSRQEYWSGLPCLLHIVPAQAQKCALENEWGCWMPTQVPGWLCMKC